MIVSSSSWSASPPVGGCRARMPPPLGGMSISSHVWWDLSGGCVGGSWKKRASFSVKIRLCFRSGWDQDEVEEDGVR